MGSWFIKCLPKIKEIKSNLPLITSDLNKIKGVNGLYLWGEVYENINNPEHRVKNIDIVAKTSFHSGDLLSIDNDITKLHMDDNSLEDKGYDPYSVFFSKKFIELPDYNINKWAISYDNKLLHWGAILKNKKDTDYIIQEAEKFADTHTGIRFKDILKKGDKDRKIWYENYHNYLKKYFEGMPSGWYRTESVKKKDFLRNTIKI